jgi:YVTN family beta-propeller protein
MKATLFASMLVAQVLAQAVPASAQSPAQPSLDYDMFKASVQPILLNKRPGNARCVSCHTAGGAAYLQRLAPGQTTWDEEQSQKNFDRVKRLVVPGAPEKSRLLMHPLAVEAGGDEFHGGGKHFMSRDSAEWRVLAAWVRGEKEVRLKADTTDTSRTGKNASVVSGFSRTTPGVRIVQTNSAGDAVSLIDPATNKVVGEIPNIEVNHGAAAAPDGSRLYVTNEADSTLDMVDSKTLSVVKRVPLSGHPNNLSISKDGRRVYIAIAQAPGAVDVVDAVSATLAKSIPIEGAGHNTYVTPDGKFVVAGSVAGKSLTVIDQAAETVAWSMKFEGGVRPITFEKKADGSTGRMFVQVSDFHGFAVVDFATHKEIGRVTLPDPLGQPKNTQGIQGSPSHGIGITPDGKVLWATSKWYHYVAAYSMPDLKFLGTVQVGHEPDWLTFTPDSKTVYVACAGSNYVSAVDVKTLKETTRIAVGQVPKRNITAVLQ